MSLQRNPPELIIGTISFRKLQDTRMCLRLSHATDVNSSGAKGIETPDWVLFFSGFAEQFVESWVNKFVMLEFVSF